MQIGDEYYEDLTPETTVKILDALAKGEKPKPGPQSGRFTAENSAGLTTLTSTVSPQRWSGRSMLILSPLDPASAACPSSNRYRLHALYLYIETGLRNRLHVRYHRAGHFG